MITNAKSLETHLTMSSSVKFPKIRQNIISEHKDPQAGRILEGLKYPDGRDTTLTQVDGWYGGKETILKYDWTKVARFASGAQSIGLHDIAWGLRSPNTEEYLIHGIVYDLINGVYDQQPENNLMKYF